MGGREHHRHRHLLLPSLLARRAWRWCRWPSPTLIPLLLTIGNMFSMFGDEHEPSSTQDLSLGAFSIQTPTIGPVSTEPSNSDSSKDAEKQQQQQPRRSPRLTPLFQSPVFTLNTPVIGCASLPAAFSIADTSR